MASSRRNASLRQLHALRDYILTFGEITYQACGLDRKKHLRSKCFYKKFDLLASDFSGDGLTLLVDFIKEFK